ncbi:hypothetical protein HD806DRAFT_510048 [Xylariaceae sp. AK1471]|nr:hypothetical protein HD806DRAFT_510048 [Xylariaceae sp. AK1471]
MTTWLSTHGIGAIKDSDSTFSIVAESGSAVVKPTQANQLTGWLHFVIPSPPVTNPNLKTLAIDFSTQGATVEGVAVYLANNEIYTKNKLQRGQSFTLKILSAESTYDGKGVAVSVFIKFTGVTSTLNFQSVAIEV